MNNFGYSRTALFGVMSGLLFALAASAQTTPSAAGMNAAVMKLFGNVPGFASKATLRVLDGSGKEIMTGPIDVAFLQGKFRMRMDVNQLKNPELTPVAVAQMNKMGLADRITVIRQDKKLIYAFFPGQKAVLNVPFSKEDVEATAKPPTIQKTPLGKETIDSHPCTKYKAVVTDARNQRMEATTWNAADLKDFPVQIQTTENGKTSIIRFTQLQMVQPDAKLFDPPAGYKEYTNQKDLMTDIAQKIGVGGMPR